MGNKIQNLGSERKNRLVGGAIVFMIVLFVGAVFLSVASENATRLPSEEREPAGLKIGELNKEVGILPSDELSTDISSWDVQGEARFSDGWVHVFAAMSEAEYEKYFSMPTEMEEAAVGAPFEPYFEDALILSARLPEFLPEQTFSPLSPPSPPSALASVATTSASERRQVRGMPALAVVMDDCGFNMEMARRVASLNLSITWAIIPYLKYSAATAELLRAHDTPFIIHVPMQAYVDPDRTESGRRAYAIGVGMSQEEVRTALLPMLDSLPDAYGINNHRGSKATSDPGVMRSVMNVLAERNLFFMDSATSSKTVAYRTAASSGLRAAKNNYFLDNESNVAKIEAQFGRALKGALRNGSAIAICHLRPETVVFLERLARGQVSHEGVRLVTLPELMELRKGE